MRLKGIVTSFMKMVSIQQIGNLHSGHFELHKRLEDKVKTAAEGTENTTEKLDSDSESQSLDACVFFC